LIAYSFTYVYTIIFARQHALQVIWDNLTSAVTVQKFNKRLNVYGHFECSQSLANYLNDV